MVAPVGGHQGPALRYGRGVLLRWQGGRAAIVVTVAAGVLIVLDTTDAGLRRWWLAHALTTDMVSGLIGLLITVLVIDQVLRLRQINDRARAVAAQAAIMVNQAIRSSQAVSQAVASSGDRDAAGDEFRTYMIMLLVGAPVLIDAKASRDFLEQAQYLGGEMALLLGVTPGPHRRADPSTTRLDAAVQRLKDASAPLLQVLDPATRAAVRGEDPGGEDPG
jgi:hypothetical protein